MLAVAVVVDIKNEDQECTVFMRFISFSEHPVLLGAAITSWYL